MRQVYRSFMAAEALLSVASRSKPGLAQESQSDHRRAEWCWTMLADHAWSGSNEANRQVNAALRRNWNQDLIRHSQNVLERSWKAMGLERDDSAVTLFNPLSVPRADLVGIDISSTPSAAGVQVVEEDDGPVAYFMSPEVSAYGSRIVEMGAIRSPGANLRTSPAEMEGPYYRLRIDSQTGGVASLLHKPTGA